MATLTPAEQIAGIACDGTLHSGTRLALAARLEQMCVLREFALDWREPEGVHKMRVASRRLRCALQDFAPYLGQRHGRERTKGLLKEIKQLAGALGAVRDLDVSISMLEQTAAKAPAKGATGIERFAEAQADRRQAARANLSTVLTPESLAKFSETFTEMLAADFARARVTQSPNQAGSIANPLTYREGAAAIVRNRLHEFEELSNSLYQPLKTKPLHKMRIAGKHLRYALILFEHCLGPQASFFAEQVAGLQSSLGKLHDCDVWIADVAQTLKANASELDLAERASLVWLLRHLIRQRAKNLSRALKQWQKWQAKDLSAGIRKMLDVSKRPATNL